MYPRFETAFFILTALLLSEIRLANASSDKGADAVPAIARTFLRSSDAGADNSNVSRRTAAFVYYCHLRKNGKFRLREKDVAKVHRIDTSKHGFPWSPVPSQSGKIFDSSCTVIDCPCGSGVACTEVSNSGDLTGLSHQCATPAPVNQPTPVPSSRPSTTPSVAPSNIPSKQPSSDPSSAPSSLPSKAPSTQPGPTTSTAPSMTPSNQPSGTPTGAPSTTPSKVPSQSIEPSQTPSKDPTGPPVSSCGDCMGGDCVNGFCKLTGTIDEIQPWCDALPAGRKCCQGTNACLWHHDKVTMFETSCNGIKACYDLGVETAYTFGPGSCSSGYFACHSIGNSATVGSSVTLDENACSGGDYACWGLAPNADGVLSVHIGKDACSGYNEVCTALAAGLDRKGIRSITIGAGSCTGGPNACFGIALYGRGDPDPLTTVTIEEDSCIGDGACSTIAQETANMEYVRVDSDSCIGEDACRGIAGYSSYRSVTISGGSCQINNACLNFGKQDTATGDYVI